MLSIRLATTQEEIQSIYRLRYQVYVEEIALCHPSVEIGREPWSEFGEKLISCKLNGYVVEIRRRK